VRSGPRWPLRPSVRRVVSPKPLRGSGARVSAWTPLALHGSDGLLGHQPEAAPRTGGRRAARLARLEASNARSLSVRRTIAAERLDPFAYPAEQTKSGEAGVDEGTVTAGAACEATGFAVGRARDRPPRSSALFRDRARVELVRARPIDRSSASSAGRSARTGALAAARRSGSSGSRCGAADPRARSRSTEEMPGLSTCAAIAARTRTPRPREAARVVGRASVGQAARAVPRVEPVARRSPAPPQPETVAGRDRLRRRLPFAPAGSDAGQRSGRSVRHPTTIRENVVHLGRDAHRRRTSSTPRTIAPARPGPGAASARWPLPRLRTPGVMRPSALGPPAGGARCAARSLARRVGPLRRARCRRIRPTAAGSATTHGAAVGSPAGGKRSSGFAAARASAAPARPAVMRTSDFPDRRARRASGRAAVRLGRLGPGGPESGSGRVLPWPPPRTRSLASIGPSSRSGQAAHAARSHDPRPGRGAGAARLSKAVVVSRDRRHRAHRRKKKDSWPTTGPRAGGPRERSRTARLDAGPEMRSPRGMRSLGSLSASRSSVGPCATPQRGAGEIDRTGPVCSPLGSGPIRMIGRMVEPTRTGLSTSIGASSRSRGQPLHGRRPHGRAGTAATRSAGFLWIHRPSGRRSGERGALRSERGMIPCSQPRRLVPELGPRPTHRHPAPATSAKRRRTRARPGPGCRRAPRGMRRPFRVRTRGPARHRLEPAERHFDDLGAVRSNKSRINPYAPRVPTGCGAVGADGGRARSASCDRARNRAKVRSMGRRGLEALRARSRKISGSPP
jgi:hypothetical protein